MVPVLYLPQIDPPGRPEAQNSVQNHQKIDGGLDVTFDEYEYDASTGELVFKGHITATYGETKVTCDILRLNPDTQKGQAEDGVLLTDPEGTLRASSLVFDWKKKTGTAKKVVLQSDSAYITAETTDVTPERWELTNAEGALSSTGNAPIKFQASSVTISPGRGGVARRVYIRVFGSKIGPLARVSFSLRKRVKGLGLPSITNRKGKGLGISWDGGIAMGDHGVLSGFWETFPRREPGFGLQYSFSPLDPETGSLISPQTELDERYADGWFDNVSVRTSDEEHDNIRTRRSSFAVGTFFNQSTTARPVDSDNVSKMFDFVVEESGPLMRGDPLKKPDDVMKSFGYFGSARVQRARQDNSKPWIDRVLFEGSLLSPRLPINSRLDAQARFDFFGTMSQNGTFGWGRVEAGLVYRPSSGLTIGVAYGYGSGSGTPDFTYDGLSGTRTVNARADYRFGPYTVRYLAKYDLGRSLWYDKEYELSIVAKQFEPFLVYRQFPSETRIGIRFRIDNLRDRLTRRKQGR